MRMTSGTKRHPHDDAPDTAAAFVRLAGLPAGPERQALREEIIRSWLPMSERVAGRYRGKGESVEDLNQVAALGEVGAVVAAPVQYDEGRGRCAVGLRQQFR
ncbi:hypothetical protein ABZ474_27905, partial [Streptomyces mirabilis]